MVFVSVVAVILISTVLHMKGLLTNMCDKNMDCIITGDSFVSGLLGNFVYLFKDSVKPVNFDEAVAHELKVNDNFGHFFLLRKLGTNVNYWNFDYVTTNLRPALIMIDLGTNDLANGTDPTLLACKLFDLSEKLHIKHGSAI